MSTANEVASTADTPAAGELRINVDLRAIRRAIVVIIGVLFLVNIPAAWVASDGERFFFDHPQAKWFLLDAERNIPTLYACIQLAACMGLTALHALVSRHDKTGDALRWGVLSLGFGYLTMDEGLQIHERFDSINLNILPIPTGFNWVLVGAAAVVVVGAFFLPWVLRRPPRLRNGMLVGGALFVGGSLVLESVGGAIVESVGFGSPFYPVASSLEELAELAGIAVFLVAALRRLLVRIGDRPVVVVDADANENSDV